MNTNIDYQWPSSFCQTKKFNEQLAHENTEAIYSEIESFFKSVFHKDCVLFPSGRGLISQILKYNKIGRSKLVFAPKWSPYCVLNAIAFHSNITSELTNKVDVMIANHKWGVAKEVDSDKFGLVIEDSVDSIIQSKDFLFPNGGKYEIISLPKVIGSYSGAILFSKDLNFFDYIKNRIGKNKGLAIRQSRVRNKIMMGESNHHDVWNEGEMINYSLDYNALIDIRGKLMNFKINKEIIISRLEKIISKLSLDIDFSQRLGPVLPLPFSEYDIDFDKIMCRHFNFNKNEGDGIYEKVFLIPLHFGISDSLFENILNKIKKK